MEVIPEVGMMISLVMQDIGWAVIFSMVGGLVGLTLVLLSAWVLPRFIGRLTPNLDEEKEMARGNLAVATFFGKVVAASVIGVSLVAAAAVLGGILAALH
jgi:hypothetical protein